MVKGIYFCQTLQHKNNPGGGPIPRCSAGLTWASIYKDNILPEWLSF
ncbi:hypothetical protein E2C01_043925 [Portunus trituberculatus]|uniref:Uncharacterized protein n=1 Tax=Portunus trituberculatus TaxID=210409 RepID=A0A5B7FYL2_PORTR|nr:hypothetical protein [Portunus trituberculatus]